MDLLWSSKKLKKKNSAKWFAYQIFLDLSTFIQQSAHVLYCAFHFNDRWTRFWKYIDKNEIRMYDSLQIVFRTLHKEDVRWPLMFTVQRQHVVYNMLPIKVLPRFSTPYCLIKNLTWVLCNIVNYTVLYIIKEEAICNWIILKQSNRMIKLMIKVLGFRP